MPGGASSCVWVSVFVVVVSACTVSPIMFVMVICAFSVAAAWMRIVNEPWEGSGNVVTAAMTLLTFVTCSGHPSLITLAPKSGVEKSW